MSISVTCPLCAKVFPVKDRLAGRHIRCSGCKKTIEVPVPFKVAVQGSASSKGGFWAWAAAGVAGLVCVLALVFAWSTYAELQAVKESLAAAQAKKSDPSSLDAEREDLRAQVAKLTKELAAAQGAMAQATKNGKNGESIVLDLEGPSGSVTSVSFSPDGRFLAAAGEGETAVVWEAATGKLYRTFKGHHSVTFSRDSERIATPVDANLGRVKVWNVLTRQETLTLHSALGFTTVGYSPDGKLLAGTGSDGGLKVRVWNATTGQEAFTLKGHRALDFSPDSKRLATALGETVLMVCDAQSGQEDLLIQVGKGMLMSACFSPDGQHLANPVQGTVKIWDAKTGEEILSFKGEASCICYSPDGKLLAGASGPDIKIWQAATGTEVATLKGHTGRIHSIGFNADSKRLASGSKDGTVKVWLAAQ